MGKNKKRGDLYWDHLLIAVEIADSGMEDDSPNSSIPKS
jgi:hypothetical protein